MTAGAGPAGSRGRTGTGGGHPGGPQGGRPEAGAPGGGWLLVGAPPSGARRRSRVASRGGPPTPTGPVSAPAPPAGAAPGGARLLGGARRYRDRTGETYHISYSPERLWYYFPLMTRDEAIDILREYAVSQMPVVKAEPPVTAGEVVGSVIEKELLDALFNGRAHLADPVERHMSPSLPIVGAGEPVTAATAALEKSDALLVHEDGKPAGVLTRQDLLGFLAAG